MDPHAFSSSMPAIRTRRTRHRQLHPYYVGPAQLPMPASPPAYSNPPPPPPPYQPYRSPPPRSGRFLPPASLPRRQQLGFLPPSPPSAPLPSANLNGPVASPANATPTPVPTPAFPAQTGTTISVKPPAFTVAAPTNVNGPIGASTSASAATSSLTEAAPASGGS
ncbi:hypothetical protein B0H11DRAFT_1926352 [Mycena galericulata]|nr:hypothetical protein B0H11DRAFT_1926352 [Mycena galericulata]